jgi:hypothetical protein
MELPDEDIKATWTQIKKKYKEDVAQEALCQALEKASRGEVEKPLHYAAVSASNIAKDQRKRQAYVLAYQEALSGKRLDWEPEREGTEKDSSVVYKKLPLPAPRGSWDQPALLEVLELLREMALDPAGQLLLRQARGERVRITRSQESKVRAWLREKLKAERRESEDLRSTAVEPYT